MPILRESQRGAGRISSKPSEHHRMPSNGIGSGDSRYKVFAFFYALQALFGVAESWLDPLRLPQLGVAVLLLLFPGSAGLMILAGLIQIALAAYKMPQVGNHYLLLALLNIMMLASYLHLRSRRRFGREAWIDETAPVFRWTVLIVYFFTFFDKLNDGFIDRRTSCAVFLYKVTASKLPLASLPEPGAALAAWLIIAVLSAEFAIPALLLFRPTRGYGILIGILFHSFLGFTHYVFSAFIYTAYVLFLPKAFFDGVARRWKPLRWPVALGLLAFLALFFFEDTASSQSVWQSPWRQAGPYAWAAFSFCLFLAYAYYFFTGKIEFKNERVPAFLGIRWGLLWIFPAAFFINGLSPYLGLKTANSFNMFSNLVTEGGKSNHWIIPSGAIEIFSYQRDLVTVSGANVPSLYALVENRTPIPYLELRRRISSLVAKGERNLHIAFIRQGEALDLPHAESDPYLSKPLPWFLGRMVYFRENLELSPISDVKCSW